MTCCVAALCEEGKTLVLVADKMVGIGFVEAEPQIKKLRKIHRDWWVLFAGEDITPVFDIIDYAKTAIAQDSTATLQSVKNAVEAAFERKRRELAVARFLRPIGWDLDSFNAGGHNSLVDGAQIQANIRDYELPIEMIVAGFEGEAGHIFTITGYGETRGNPSRCDIPGFVAIGSGSTAALYMMYYRNLSPKNLLREALILAVEAKYFGEQASGVGESTDVYVVEPEGKEIMLDEETTVEEKLFKICYQVGPREFTKKHIDVLNRLPELSKFAKIEKPRKKRKSKLIKKNVTASVASAD